MKYDDASWHSESAVAAGSPEEYGGTHIGMFLKWCFVKGWASDLHTSEEPVDTQAVIDGTLSGTDFLFKYCDGKLTNEDFDLEGLKFTDAYYGDDGFYLADYAKHFSNLMYLAPEGAHDFQRFSAILESRLRSGIIIKSQAKPWWRFW
jgi:hypothetical protein